MNILFFIGLLLVIPLVLTIGVGIVCIILEEIDRGGISWLDFVVGAFVVGLILIAISQMSEKPVAAIPTTVEKPQ